MDELQKRLAALRDELRGLVDLGGSITDEQASRADEIAAEIRDVTDKIEAAERRQAVLAEAEKRAKIADEVEARDSGKSEHRPATKVTSEERTYTREKDIAGRTSFFRDAFLSQVVGDTSARARLDRHAREVEVEGEIQTRATTTGSYAGLVVPQYLVDLAANVLRNGRPMANACTRLPLPDQGMSFIVPRATTGVSAASQATENTAVSNTDQVWANTTVPVATIAGQQVVSRQSLERGTPGIDQLIYADLAAAYAAELDRQIFVGTGASGQLTGINGQSGINTATAFGGAVTTTNFYSKLAGQIAAVAGAGTAVQPSLIVMAPRRWGWLTLQVDTAGRPLVTPVVNGLFNSVGVNSMPGGHGSEGDPTSLGYNIVGYLHGLPVTTDANVPTNIGTPAEDLVFVFDQRMALLFEDGDGMPRQLRFEQTQGNNLSVILAAYNYVAFTAGRYPAAFGRVGGADTVAAQGLVNPTF